MVNSSNGDEVRENAANFSMSNLTNLNSTANSTEGYQRFANIILNQNTLPSKTSTNITPMVATKKENEKLDALQPNLDTKKTVHTNQSLLRLASEGVCFLKNN